MYYNQLWRVSFMYDLRMYRLIEDAPLHFVALIFVHKRLTI